MIEHQQRVADLLRKQRRHDLGRLVWGLLVFLVLYLIAAYLLLPTFWSEVESRRSGLDLPDVTRTASGLPGDPLNVALVGSENELIGAMHAAGWRAADPVTFRTSVRISESVLFDRPDPNAPVSNLYLWGRRQDLAFEQTVDRSARRRHHVRFWQSRPPADVDRAFWIGAATFDTGAGFSHRTGQVTHHIAPDVDAERSHLVDSLEAAGRVVSVELVPGGRGPTQRGRNGNGDRYVTDGRIAVAVLTTAE